MFGTIKKDMQLTKPEFARRVPRVLSGYDWRETADGYRAVRDGQTIEISIQTLEPRKIGNIVLPRCEVSFLFDGGTGDDQQAFLKTFERIYQKGGG